MRLPTYDNERANSVLANANKTRTNAHTNA
jgi:hypothetical protein